MNEALSQIRIHYMKSASDLIYFLASIQSLPLQKRPRGGIVVDDLDYYIREASDDNDVRSVLFHSSGGDADVDHGPNERVVDVRMSPNGESNGETDELQHTRRPATTKEAMKLIQLCKSNC